jgi:hypothetical protein
VLPAGNVQIVLGRDVTKAIISHLLSYPPPPQKKIHIARLRNSPLSYL